MAENVESTDDVSLYERWRDYIGTRDGTTVFFVVIGVFCLVLLQLFLAVCQFYYRRTLNRNLEMRGLLETTSSQERTEAPIVSRIEEERYRISPNIDNSGTILVEVHELTHLNSQLG